ncbi:phosphotransferase family protein [Actinopolymorpha alba]|uniref:phosphotransferase family protein n=1 Tax=Actinopolymorpha alba TaxID=533267 RepID=UPI00036AADD4|nr:phosphotransferase [Actinopolymorpha alba]
MRGVREGFTVDQSVAQVVNPPAASLPAGSPPGGSPPAGPQAASPPHETAGSPPATGVRLPWSAIPAALQAAVEDHLGSRVVESVTQPGGFSPGVAAKLRLDNGTRAFVKAVGPEPNPESPDIHRSEARIAAALPVAAPAPRLLASFDEAGWVVLVYENVEGTTPRQPWDRTELDRVMNAVHDLAVTLTPSPIEVPPAAERFSESFAGWHRLAEAHQTGKDDLTGLDPWARQHLTDLAAWESRWSDAAAGTTLAHADLRADNVLLTHDRVVVVDWPWACTTTPWFDLLAMLPSVAMQGGPSPEELFDHHPVADGADPDAVTAVLVALTGFFLEHARRPAPPGLPTLRAFQAAQGHAALRWLRSRLRA